MLIGSFLLSALLIVVSIVAFKAWRKRDDWRSPLSGKKLAKLPGQQLTARINDHGDELVIALITMYLSIPIMVFAWVLARLELKSARLGFNELLSAAVALFIYGLRSLMRTKKAPGTNADVDFPTERELPLVAQVLHAGRRRRSPKIQWRKEREWQAQAHVLCMG